MKLRQSLFAVLCLSALLQSCYTDKTAPLSEPEYLEFNFKGIAVDAVKNSVDQNSFTEISDLNADAVSLRPRGVLIGGSDTIEYDRNGFEWGEKSTGITAQIGFAKLNGLSVLIDPWVEFPPAESSAEYDAGDSTGWAKFEQSYLKYIVHFANIAENEGADVFCIGSDMENFVIQQDTFWTSLIDTVRKVFAGELTYGANYKNYDDIPFWSDLDYIGIQAYFFVSLSQTPQSLDVEQHWVSSLIPALSAYSSSQQRNVLFTQIGYRSIDYCGEQVLNEDTTSTYTVNVNAQENCISGFLNALRNRSWFDGAFIRGWTLDKKNKGAGDDSYSPQAKSTYSSILSIYLDAQ